MFESSIERTPYQTYGEAIRPAYNAAPMQQYAQPQYYKPPSVWDTYRSMLIPPGPQMSPVESAVTGIRHMGEGAAMAALLALGQKHFGLDFWGKYPVDAILGVVLFGLSVKEAGKPNGYAQDLRALAQSCGDVFVYRKVLGDGGNTSKTLPSAPATVSMSGDPILEAARQAGF